MPPSNSFDEFWVDGFKNLQKPGRSYACSYGQPIGVFVTLAFSSFVSSTTTAMTFVFTSFIMFFGVFFWQAFALNCRVNRNR